MKKLTSEELMEGIVNWKVEDQFIKKNKDRICIIGGAWGILESSTIPQKLKLKYLNSLSNGNVTKTIEAIEDFLINFIPKIKLQKGNEEDFNISSMKKQVKIFNDKYEEILNFDTKPYSIGYNEFNLSIKGFSKELTPSNLPSNLTEITVSTRRRENVEDMRNSLLYGYNYHSDKIHMVDYIFDNIVKFLLKKEIEWFDNNDPKTIAIDKIRNLTEDYGLIIKTVEGDNYFDKMHYLHFMYSFREEQYEMFSLEEVQDLLELYEDYSKELIELNKSFESRSIQIREKHEGGDWNRKYERK